MTHRPLTALLLALAGCTSTAPPPAPPPPVVAPPPPPALAAAAAPAAAPVADDPVSRGELPWWHDLEPGIYADRGTRIVYAVGRSAEHHHVAEGFLRAKVVARLGVRKAAEPVAFSGTMPEPELSDLFITRKQKFFALYRMPLPEGSELAVEPRALDIPEVLEVPGRRRIGRHVFEGRRHLYLECEVEGPVANPDWGRSRATAMWTP